MAETIILPAEAKAQGRVVARRQKSTRFFLRFSKLQVRELRAQAKASGLTRYMGNPCIHGHSGERLVSNGTCIECKQEEHRKKRADPAFLAMEAEKERLRRLANPEKYAERDKRWRDDPEHKAIKARVQRDRRARKRLAGGKHTAEDVAEIFVKQHFKCAYCRKNLRNEKFECDHIVPLASGGANDRNNIQILCPRCNRRKRSTDPIKFAQRWGLLL